MKKKVFIFVLMMFMFIPNVSASSCSSSELSRLRKLASLIKFDIKYVGNVSEDEYGIQISNMSDEFFVSLNESLYYGDKIITGLISKQRYRLEVDVSGSNPCWGEFSYFRYITMPAYNKYHNSSYCDGVDISYCDITYDSSNMTEDEFKSKIDSYLDSQNVVDIVEDDGIDKMYFVYGGIGLVVLLVAGILFVKLKSKKNN